MPDYSIRVNAPLVNVDVLVYPPRAGSLFPTSSRIISACLKTVRRRPSIAFAVSKAPITAVLLVEFASTRYSFMIDALQASYAFANTLRKDGLGCGFLLRTLQPPHSWWISPRTKEPSTGH